MNQLYEKSRFLRQKVQPARIKSQKQDADKNHEESPEKPGEKPAAPFVGVMVMVDLPDDLLGLRPLRALPGRLRLFGRLALRFGVRRLLIGIGFLVHKNFFDFRIFKLEPRVMPPKAAQPASPALIPPSTG